MSFAHPWALTLLLLPVFWVAIDWRRGRRNISLVLTGVSAIALVLALSQPELRKRGAETVAITVSAENIEGGTRSIDAAVREGIATLPAGRVRRLVIFGAGQVTPDSADRAISQARRLGIPIDIVPATGPRKPNVHLEMEAVPAWAYSGEPFPIDLLITSPQLTDAEVALSAGGKVLLENRLTLSKGENRLRLQPSLESAGAVEMSVAIRAGSVGEAHFSQLMNVRRARILVVSPDPNEVDPDLKKSLSETRFEVTRSAAVPASIAPAQLLVIEKWNLAAIPTDRKAAIETFVRQGGGLVVIGGDNSSVKPDAREDALDRTLPARIARRSAPESSCVVLVLERSASMEGAKMELAKLAALGLVENLRQSDLVGVLAFDDGFEWAVPIHRDDERDPTDQVIENVSVRGGTRIGPAIGEALRRIQTVNATSKHIILVTDGRSQDFSTLALARQAAEHEVTISTVGVGEDTNRAYLDTMARSARGASYFLKDPSVLEMTVVEDAIAHSASPAVETTSQSSRPARSDMLVVSKAGAQVVGKQRDRNPSLVRWQYGRGYAEVVTQDAENPLNQRGAILQRRFWRDVFGYVLHTEAGSPTTRYDAANDELVIDYTVGRHGGDSVSAPDLVAIGPQGFERPVTIEKLDGRIFRGRVHVDHALGLFQILPLNDSRAFPEVQIYRDEESLNESNEVLLRRISESTGGRFNPKLGGNFDSNRSTNAAPLPLWPLLVAVALGLILVDRILNRRGTITHRFKHHHVTAHHHV